MFVKKLITGSLTIFTVVAAMAGSETPKPEPIPTPAATGQNEDSTAVRINALNLSFIYERYGNLEPCGCSYNPMGGVERESSALKQWKKTYPGTWKHFSSSTTFLQVSNEENPYKTPFNLKKGLALTKALNQLKTAAVSITPADIRVGCKNLKALKRVAKFPFVATNSSVSDKICQNLTVTYHVIKDVKPNLVVLSLWKPKDREVDLMPERVSFFDPEAIVLTLLEKPELKNATWVFLHNLEDTEVRRIAAKVPHTQLWLGGRADLNYVISEQQGKSAVLNAIDSEGKNLGLVRFENKNTKGTFFNTRTSRLAQKQLKDYQETLTDLQEKIKDTEGKEKQEYQYQIDGLKDWITVLTAMPATDSPDWLHYLVTKVVLDKTYTDPKGPMSKILSSYKNGLRAQALKEDAPTKN